LPNFVWKGIRTGVFDEGVIEAKNRHEAAYLLRKQNLIITSIEAEKSHSSLSSLLPKREKKGISGKVKSKDVMIFTKKLATMIRAGLPVPSALQLLATQVENKALAAMIENVLVEVEEGKTVSEAFSRYDKVFDVVYVNLLRAGEASGRLDVFLEKLVENLEKAEAVRSSIKKALFYPAVLMIVAIAVIIIMLIYVVPIFADLFEAAGGELPALTAMVMNASHFVQDPARGGVLFGSIFFGVIGYRAYLKKNYKGRRAFHRFLLRLPLVRDLILKSSLSKLGMIMGNLSSAGLPLLEAIDIATSSLKNLVLVEAMSDVRTGVYSGNPISTLFEKEKVFPRTFSQMLSVGEETGNMEEMYSSVSRYYQEELDSTVQQMTSILEPFMIIFMGATVGFIILAMYLPIFSMGQIVG